MVPVGLLPPARLATSSTCPPTVTVGEAVVTRVGVTGPGPAVTTTDSLASLHAVVTALLLASPLYCATHRKVPAWVVVNGPEAYWPLPLTVTGALVNAGVA